MMSSRIIYDDQFAHGTPSGYLSGCRGAHCPAPVSCRDTHRRYAGDAEFRRRFDAGDPIIVSDGVKLTSKGMAVPVHAARVWAKPEAAPRRAGGSKPNEARDEEVRHLHALGWTDREIGEKFGVTKIMAFKVRKRLGLPAVGRRKKAAA